MLREATGAPMIKRLLLFAVALPFSHAAVGDTATPSAWLDRMSSAVATMDFAGTVIRRRDGQSEALKVVRKIVDGVAHEKLVTQEGNGLEILRYGSEVHCILPDRKSVLVDFWSGDSTLFSSLPSSEVSLGSEYDLSLMREERVAGRPALLLAVRPHDGYRYGHRVWLDRETAFPLRTELVGGDGALLDQLKFADVELDSDISANALKPSFDLEGFTWYPEPTRADPVEIDTNWVSDDLPAGFRVLSATNEALPDSGVAVTHIMISDGLANVSVFIADNPERAVVEYTVHGNSALAGSATNSHSVDSGEYLITAIGEVPAATVRRIANSMRLLP